VERQHAHDLGDRPLDQCAGQAFLAADDAVAGLDPLIAGRHHVAQGRDERDAAQGHPDADRGGAASGYGSVMKTEA
jgi:hypothetical protein